jgi:hypothetical protein
VFHTHILLKLHPNKISEPLDLGRTHNPDPRKIHQTFFHLSISMNHHVSSPKPINFRYKKTNCTRSTTAFLLNRKQTNLKKTKPEVPQWKLSPVRTTCPACWAGLTKHAPTSIASSSTLFSYSLTPPPPFRQQIFPQLETKA